jgi:hypothetical protein
MENNMNLRMRAKRGGGCAWLLILALVGLTNAGCAVLPDTPPPSSPVTHQSERQARAEAAAAVATASEVFQPRDTSDLYSILDRRKAAGVDRVRPRETTNEHPHRLFAVLVNGGREGYHQTNILNASNALRRLGADAKNLFILSTGVPWMDINAYDPSETPFQVTAKPTATNFKLVLEYLGSVITSNDVVWLYVTGHGGKEDEYQALRYTQLPTRPLEACETNLSTIALQGASFTALDLQRQLEQLQRHGNPLIVFLSDECYGGGMARMVKETTARHIAMSITDENHTTYCQTFSPYFWKILACKKWDTQEYPTLKEAFDKAMEQRRPLTRNVSDTGEYFCSAGLEDFSLADVY